MPFDALRVASVSQRPGSSHSNRPVSRTSQRPTSRLSQRTITKQPRLVALLTTLVKQVTESNAKCVVEDSQGGMELAIKQIDQMKHATTPDPTQVDAHFRGHIEKARINVQDTLADVLCAKYAELKASVIPRKDLYLEIKPSMLPNHLHFLLLLSAPPTASTLSQAEIIIARGQNDIPQSPILTWEKILKEEPFEGQHWQGAYGLPKGSTVERWEEESSDSDNLSLLEDADCEKDSSDDGDQHQPHPRNVVLDQSLLASRDRDSREVVEALQERQYWRPGWHADASDHRKFDIGDSSTLGPTLDRIAFDGAAIIFQQKACLNEVDAVREVLMTLQGFQSYLFRLASEKDGCDVKVSFDRRIVHFSENSQISILTSFASFASTLIPLRYLIKNQSFHRPHSVERCRTFEAFSAAIEHQLYLFDRWCARKEENIILAQSGCIPNHVVSLLSLEREVAVHTAGTFNVLLDIIRMVESKRNRSTPSVLSALILNKLLDAVRTHHAIGNSTTAGSLLDVWRKSAEPLWSSVERWLRDGIPIQHELEGDNLEASTTGHEPEFFIRSNLLVDIGSPDFWEGGYTLPSRHSKPISEVLSGESQPDEMGTPSFLTHVAEDILAAGKAIGLLRAIDMVYLVGDSWLKDWINFTHLTESLSLEDLDKALENLVSETLRPSCRLAQSWLRQVLIEECELWKHVQGFENVYLMTRGDAMSQFGEKLFTRMDNRQPWNDFHFLNTAFRDVTKLSSRPWINASLIRFTYRGNKDRSINRTVRAIDGLAIEYAVPFPLTYVFGPETNTGYSSLFCFLLQIRRAKSVLDRILIRGLHSAVLNYDIPDLKTFHVLRGKLSWFVNTLMTFVMTNVIHVGTLEFHDALRGAGSLDEMISIHRSHLERLLGRCLLLQNTSALHRAVLSILDLSLHFGDCLAAFAGDSSLDISRHSLVLMRHRHRHRHRYQRRNRGGHMHKPDVIGFAETLPPSEDDSESESDTEDAAAEPFATSTNGASISFAEESFFTRLDRMSMELDGLVRFVRRGVESLASGTGDASSMFGVFAFCLEDWDL